MIVVGILIISVLLIYISKLYEDKNELNIKLRHVTAEFENHLIMSEDVRDYNDDFDDFKDIENEYFESFNAILKDPILGKNDKKAIKERLEKNPHRELEIEIENSCDNWGTY